MSIRELLFELVLDQILDEIVESIGNEIIGEAFEDALETMADLCANPGQEKVFIDYVVPGFEESLQDSEVAVGWNDVDIGEYMDFMGEIVETGNQIMQVAYAEVLALGAEDAGDFDEDEMAEFTAEYGEDFF